MLSRGTFNGPGGPHSRWVVPATGGSSMGSGQMLRDKMKLGIIDPASVLNLTRDGVAASGSRGGRRDGPCRTGRQRASCPGSTWRWAAATTIRPVTSRRSRYCDGGGYDNYTVEVVDRMGTDSFTPDSGVLLSKTKDRTRRRSSGSSTRTRRTSTRSTSSLPNGTPQKMTIGDYRQLSDALFHAGTDSGSQYEYVDQANRLHFYVLNIKRDKTGVLSYTVAVRSLDGSGTQQRGVRLSPGVGVAAPRRAGRSARCRCATPARPGPRRTATRTSTGCPRPPRAAAGRRGCRTPSPRRRPGSVRRCRCTPSTRRAGRISAG